MEFPYFFLQKTIKMEVNLFCKPQSLLQAIIIVRAHIQLQLKKQGVLLHVSNTAHVKFCVVNTTRVKHFDRWFTHVYSSKLKHHFCICVLYA